MAHLARRRITDKHVPVIGAAEKESELHAQIFDECRRRGWIAFHGAMSERTHRNLGEPDFLILRDGGKLLAVEAKSAKGKLSEHQAAIAAWAEKLGHKVHVVRSINEFLELTK
jgi:predicted RecB family nuclease